MKKVLAVAAAAALAAAMVSGCSGGKTSGTGDTKESGEAAKTEAVASEAEKAEKKEDVTLTYLTMSTIYPQKADEINEELHKMYPHLTLDIVHVADNYETTVKTKFATGDAPDLFDWSGYMANKTFVEAGYMLDITDDHLNEHVLEQFKASGMYDGKVYGIPILAQAHGMIYNQSAFEKAGIAEPPKTLSELKEAVEKLKAVGITPFATGFKDVWVCNQMTWKFLAPNVGEFSVWYQDMMDGKASFLNDKTGSSFELMDIVLANTFENPLSSDAANMSNKLGTGEAAMCFLGEFQYDAIAKSDPDVKLGLAPIPVSENPEDATMEFDAQQIIFASATGSHVEDAKDALRWITSMEGAKTLSSVSGQGSAFDYDMDVTLNPLSMDGQAYVKGNGKTVGCIKTFWPSGMTTEAGKQLQNYIAGTIDKEQFFQALDDAFKKLSQQ